jgi:L-amino acid N-acyltransferase YncA
VTRVRSADLRDLPAITELYQAIADTTWEYTEAPHSIEERTAWFLERTQARWPVLVSEDRGTVTGVATYGEFRDSRRWPGYRFTVEHTIHVHRHHRGRGVGRLLMTELLAQAADAGMLVMVAAIDSANLGSVAFHSRLGFVETGRMPGVGYKWGQRLDLVLMQREVTNP